LNLKSVFSYYEVKLPFARKEMLMGHQETKIILLVENDVVLSLYDKERLEHFGYEVITAANGEKALESVFHEKKIDLVLMDLHLGQGINGLDTAEKILKHKDIPIVFTIGYADDKYFEKLKGITCYGCIYKSSGDFVFRSSIEIALNLFNLSKNSKFIFMHLDKSPVNPGPPPPERHDLSSADTIKFDSP
jgi:CheY-like chemotaxis protein